VPKKSVTKVKLCISIDKELYFRLKKYSEERMIKFSTYLEYLVKKGEKSSIHISKKSSPKIKISISIDKSLFLRIKKHCDENMIKTSTYLEYLVKKGEADE